MINLNTYLKQAKEGGYAIGHFNISNLEGLKAIVQASQNLKAPVMIGTSEGEANFVGYNCAAALIDVFRKETGSPIFLNSDHHKTYESAVRACDAGYDSIHIDASSLSYAENIELTKKVVNYVKSKNKDISVEGELGAVKGSSEVSAQKIVLTKDDYTKPDQAKEFVALTGVDRLAIAIGNIHGINLEEPDLDLELLSEIKKAVPDVFLVLHAASGIPNSTISKAIELGIVNIHINTELRNAYTLNLRQFLVDNLNEVAPYKFEASAVLAMQKVVEEKINLFKSNQKI